MSTTKTESTLCLFSTDFDGTIHEDFAVDPVPIALQQELSRLQSEGAVWVINTGRDLPSLLEGMARARMTVLPDYVVTVEREIHKLDGHRYEPVEPWHSRCIADHAELFARWERELAQLRNSLAARFDAAFYHDAWSPLCVIARDNPQMDEIQAELDGFCSKASVLSAVRNDVYVRLSHGGYSKGTALAEIQRLTGIPVSATLSAGDHMNDHSMLQPWHAAWIVTPKNGIPAIREHVRRVGGYVSEESCGRGVLDGIQWALRGSLLS